MNQTKGTRCKSNKKLLISMLTILTLLVSCASCKKVTPQEALEQAIEKTFTNTDPVENLLELTKINKAVADGTPYSSGITATLEKISGGALGDYDAFLSGIGLTVNTAADIENKQTAASIGISYGGTTYLTLATHLDTSKLYLMVPELLDGSLSIEFSTILKDIASSELFSDLLGNLDESILSSLTLDFWSLMDESGSLDLAFPKKLISKYKALWDSTTVAEVKAEDANLPTDIAVKTVYTMTLPESAYKPVAIEFANYFVEELQKALTSEALQKLITTISLPNEDTLSQEIEKVTDVLGDIVLTFAVNKDGYVSYITYGLEAENGTVACNMAFSGESSPVENIKLNVTATISDETISVEYAQSFDADTKTLSLDGTLLMPEFTASIKSEGEYTDIEKGKKYTFDLNFLEFNCSEDFGFTLSGSSYLDITSCTINAPEGTEYELFKMNLTDFIRLLSDVMANIKKDPLLSEIFGMFFD